MNNFTSAFGAQSHRIDDGLLDTSATLNFTFNGKTYCGHQGDTLASALLANGVKLVGRSFKYHRPRGIFTSGSEEPNALVQLGEGAFSEPNTRATIVELIDGLSATSQNHLGSLKNDVLAVNDLLSPFLSAGFYYKTFMWPKAFWEKIYEPMIRRAAGLGKLSGLEDPDTYDKGFLHCDLLIIGAGPTGLAAALTAAKSIAQVLLVDEDFVAGGRLNNESHLVGDMDGDQWAAQTIAELANMPNVRFLSRTTVYGTFDHGIFGALEQKTAHLVDGRAQPRQVLWRIYAKRALLCAGATERSIAFGNNDRPGVMLAGAVRAYINRFGVASGKRIAIFTNNDDGWRTASDFVAKGLEVSAIIDTRADSAMVGPKGVKVFKGGQIVDTKGRHGIKSITLASGETIVCDCLAVSGGWSPNVHLTSHQRARPVWRDDIAGFVPSPDLPNVMRVAGSAAGTMTLGACLLQGQELVQQALSELDIKVATPSRIRADDEPSSISAFWHVKDSTHRSWVDLQNDVTSKDIVQSHQEGFRSVEHLKRYTTLGMATDQGKTSNMLGLAIMANCMGRTIPETGTTIFRPPYIPVAIGAFAGRARGKDFRPTRFIPSHQWAAENNATFIEVGNWLRVQWLAKPGETHWRQSVDREVLQTRKSVGICDVTTLGKIDVQGKDAAQFLNKIYANGFAKLAIGKVRYGVMLREDGIVMDDGTCARMDEFHYVVTTTTANAVAVYRHMEFVRQCLCPDLDVSLISITEQWAQFAVAGPNSRKLLQKIIDDEHDLSNEAFPFMACGEVSVCRGTLARLFRISFSGELAFEIAVPARYGNALMATLMEEGEEFDAVAYGLEALSVMRIEKGHAAGNELVGTTTARDLGMGGMVSKTKDCIGSTLSKRAGLNTEDGLALVGFKPVDRSVGLKAGAHFVSRANTATIQDDEGWMTSVAYSPNLGHSIGLGFIKNGQNRMGEVVLATDPIRGLLTEVEISSAHFIDPEGGRLRG